MQGAATGWQGADTGLTKYKEMIRVSGKAVLSPEAEQEKWMQLIFEEQPYLENVYPGKTKSAGIIFQIKDAQVEYFNLGEHPIFRESYSWGHSTITKKGYYITDRCIGCGACAAVCPQAVIVPGKPYRIQEEHCLHCGNCQERCTVNAVKKYGKEGVQ